MSTCFAIASKALDALLTTSFAQGDNALFQTREDAIQYLDSMLVHKFFHRAKKVPVSEAELRRGKKSKEQQQPPADAAPEESEAGAAELRKRTKTSAAAAAGTDKEGSSEVDVSKSPKSSTAAADAAEKKLKRKIRLDMHPDQQFVDGAEAYIWIYDPIPVHYWLFGALLVVGAIVVCLFPLWPPTLRLGVYYLSIAAAGFLVFILSLAVIRFIVFCAVWVLTGSKHHFWLFPNLTEDVGFFASFWPLYQHTYVGGTADGVKGGSKERRNRNKTATATGKKEKLSDAEEEDTTAADLPLLAAGVEKQEEQDEQENNGYD